MSTRGNVWYRLFKHVLLGPLLRILGRPEIAGAQHIPPDGPVILASNHLAVADSFFLPLLVARPITFVAKSEYYTGSGVRGALLRWFYTATGQVPIERGGDGAGDAALRTAAAILERGAIWGIYPEGTRSPDGRLYRGKTGVMRVAFATGAPVVPVVMSGTDVVNPIGKRVWRRGRVRVTVCPPLDLTDLRAMPDERIAIRLATDRLMQVLAEVSGREYVDEYAVRGSRGPAVWRDRRA